MYHDIYCLLVLQEGTSKFATLELNPKRAQRRHQQQRDLVSPHKRFIPTFFHLLQLHPQERAATNARQHSHRVVHRSTAGGLVFGFLL